MGENGRDVIMVGAGFAGAAAASHLCERASDHGARGPRSAGGTGVYPCNSTVRRSVGVWGRMGFSASKPHPALRQQMRFPAETDGARDRKAMARWPDLRSEAPAAPDDVSAYKEGRALIVDDARRYAKGAPSTRTGETHRTEHEQLSASHRCNSRVTRPGDGLVVHFRQWGSGRDFGGGVLSSCAHGDYSPEGMMPSLNHSLVSGAGELASRMIESCGRAAPGSGAEVGRIQRFRMEVIGSEKRRNIQGQGGSRRRAPQCLDKLRFAPSLGQRKRRPPGWAMARSVSSCG